MNRSAYGLFLACAGAALAACQASSTTTYPQPSVNSDSSSNEARDPDEWSQPAASTTASSQPAGSTSPYASTRTDSATTGSTAYGTRSTLDEDTSWQAGTVVAPEDAWGPGTMHVAVNASFSEDDEQNAGSTDTLHVEAEYGYLFTNNLEANVSGVWDNVDSGTTESNRGGVLAGLRLYVITPEDESDIGVYGEGKVGILTVDQGGTGPGNDTDNDLAGGVAAGILWWPWGVEHGMAFEGSVDYLATSEIDRIGAFLGMGFWW